jgi:hypothetical protein
VPWLARLVAEYPQGNRKLPTIDGYSKHLLDDGNPRCLAFHRIKKDGEFALIEVILPTTRISYQRCC